MVIWITYLIGLSGPGIIFASQELIKWIMLDFFDSWQYEEKVWHVNL